MSPARITTVEQDLEAMLAWPDDWVVDDDDDGDLQIGRRIVEQLTGFVRHLHDRGLAASTIRRHVDHLHLLGGTLVHDRHYYDPPEPVPDLIEIVEEEGGPLIDGGECTAAQRSFDATCRKLYTFLSKPVSKPARVPASRRRRASTKTKLDSMIAEATSDAYGPEEEAGGLLVYLQDHIDLPFNTTVLGVKVLVVGFDHGSGTDLVAICKRGRNRQRIPVQDLPMSDPPPQGHEWIAACKQWLTQG